MTDETVTDVLREMAAIPFHSEVFGETVQDFAARIQAAHAREVEVNDTYIRKAGRRISVLASLLNQANVDRLREVKALRLRAEAAEADALERDAARYKWLRKHLVNWCPDDDTARLSWHAREALDAEIDAAISGDDGEIVTSGCGVEARIHFEDPRYPTLVLDGDEFGTIGYELRRDTGELRRVCICHAYCEHECVCGYDAAIASGGEDRKA